MFGTLTAQTELLTEEQLARYRACYCGLCRSLKERYGQLGRLLLNYDLCFLVLLLDSLYEPETAEGAAPCLAHPREARPWRRSAFSDYAADMTVALAYHKFRDNWQDEGSLLSLGGAAALKRAYQKARGLWPRQCGAIEASMRALSEQESLSIPDPDASAACFGALMAELFDLRRDRWAPALRALGDALGRFNPLRSRYGRDNAADFRDILKMLLADALRAFDTLPLVQDLGLLQNILCAGVWTEFDKKYKAEEGTSHGSGSL